jgi:serine/threonine protein kinase
MPMSKFPRHRPELQIINGCLYRHGSPFTIPDISLRDFIGAGANAVVFSAQQLALGRIVAVKMWFRDMRQPQSRAIEEARKLAHLSHPLLVTLHHFGIEQKIPYAVMELVRGQTLQTWLELGDRSDREKWAIWHLYYQALNYIYKSGSLHGDPHTNNVLIFEDSTGVYQSYLPQEAKGFLRLGLKLADVGTSLLWANKRDFAHRESAIVRETVGRIFPKYLPSIYLDALIDNTPSVALAFYDYYVRFIIAFDALSHIKDKDASENLCLELIDTFLHCPFIRIAKFMQLPTTPKYRRSMAWVLRHIASDAAFGINVKSIVNFSVPLGDDELGRIVSILERYKHAYAQDPKILDHIYDNF